MRLPRVESVEVLHGHTVRLGFTDGIERVVDLDPYLHGPIFDPLRSDDRLFRAVRVDPAAGTIVWPNGADVCPDVLYERIPPAWWNDPDARS